MRSLCAVCLFAAVPALADQPPVPPDCAPLDFAANGRPSMFPARDGIAYGISSPHEIFRRDGPSARAMYVPIHVWIDNRTNQDQVFETCGPTHEWVDTTGQWQSAVWRGVEVFDAHGRRRTGSTLLSDCAANVRFIIPAHTCIGSKQEGLGLPNLTDPLPPGRYFFTERDQSLPLERRAGLWISIQDKRR